MSSSATYRGPEDAPQYVLAHLDPARIRLQRERLGLTGKDLADRIEKSPSAVSQIENGVIAPDLDTLIRLGFALQVPVKFFLQRDTNTQIALDQCHFRARRNVPQYRRRQSIADASIIIQLMRVLEKEGVRFPDEQLSGFANITPTVSESTPLERMEELAVELRRHWGMGLGPIPNLVALFESKGILVLPLNDAHTDVDAFSVWHSGRPVIFLTQGKAASRDRVDGGHEVGHLAVHSDVEPNSKPVEDQAYRFGGAFLAPRASFLPECPRRWSYAAFLQLKSRWRMSMQALVRRAYDLGCLSESSYTRANVDLRKRLSRDGEEEGEWPIEQPTMIEQALSLLRRDVTLYGLAHEVGLGVAELCTLLSKCVNVELLRELSATTPDDSENDDRIVTLKRASG